MGGDVVGLVPAAGESSRLPAIPCSKEILPIGFQRGDDRDRFPRVACSALLEAFRTAGIERCYVILRSGKWDIPAYLGDGRGVGLELAYLMMGRPYGVPYTLDQAFPFVGECRVAMGFPDILTWPDDVFLRLLDAQERRGADVVLAAFPADRPSKVDMLELDADGNLVSLVIKPEATELEFTWTVAVWTPSFTQFIRDYVGPPEESRGPRSGPDGRELYLGDVIQAGLDRGLEVEAVPFPDGRYIDIGTADDLARAIRWFGESEALPEEQAEARV